MSELNRDHLSNLFDQAMKSRDEKKSEIADELQNKEARYGTRTELASGGMKRIYHVHDLSTDRDVAMAVLLNDSDEVVRENFLREARVTARLEHPNIIPVYDMGFINEEAFFTMKFLKGATLETVLEQIDQASPKMLSRFTIQERLKIFLRVCEAIEYAHSKGIIHLDIKPANIHISAMSEVTVCDWGIAKILDEVESDEDLSRYSIDQYELKNLTIDGYIKGTPGFMAPEQLSAKDKKDFRTDIYALGALLYKLLTLKNLVDTRNFDEYRRITLTGDITPPSHLDKNIDDSLEAICLKAVALKQDDRYQTVHDLLSDLNRYLDGFMPMAEGSRFVKPFILLYKRNKAFLTTLFLSTVLIILGLSYFSWSISQKEQETKQAYDELKQAQEAEKEAYLAKEKAQIKELKAQVAKENALKEKLAEQSAKELALKEKQLEQTAKENALKEKLAEQNAKEEALAAKEKAQEDKQVIAKELASNYLRDAQKAYDKLNYENAALNLKTSYFLENKAAEVSELQTKLYIASANFDELNKLKHPITTVLEKLPSDQARVKRLLQILKTRNDQKLYRIVQLNAYKKHFLDDEAKADYLAYALGLDNPSLKNIRVKFKGHSLYLSNNGNIKDLRAINGFPIKNLSFRRSKIENLNGLKLQDIRQLNLSYSNLRDLPNFEGCKFDRLDLSFCPIIFPFALSAGEIKELNVMGTSFMFDRIRDFKNIETIIVNKRFEGKVLVGLKNLKYQKERTGDLQRATRIHHFIRLDGDKNGLLPNYELQLYKTYINKWDQDQDKIISFDEFLPDAVYAQQKTELESGYIDMINKQGMALNGPNGQRGNKDEKKRPPRSNDEGPDRNGPPQRQEDSKAENDYFTEEELDVDPSL